MQAAVLKPDPAAIRKAASLLKQGGLVAMPTETVYGLAADASNADAVARLYAAKGRPAFNPLIAHCASAEAAFAQGRFSERARVLAAAFWPGPLTFVVDAIDTTTVCSLARAGLDTLALRVPAHPAARALLEAFGGPLVAPSANPSGRISPTTAAHVSSDMGDKVDLILDGGPCSEGIESTVIDARGESPVLLRQGTVLPEAIERIWPGLEAGGSEDRPTSPGQLLRHYAPNARLRLNADNARPGEALLGFGPGEATLNLSASGDLVEATANLFAMMRKLDERFDQIAVAPIPEKGLGAAINDRLVRAADRG
ncbi:threonylcarbamoyl-AMP synthase [Henriciella barbarensis]|uniref:Threonylcarbamoyl-AMP synthase n=1 Tax=Henriciella barbarensis TaxID=86342 RepID=A0A399R1A8_9PROT|nr:L-threonylcarbamoyladenylate synthase [Henriciella barbarensis]RIJ23359.1 threonylcarbamoyl-AMP synthase [Henriciella barbarensis]